MKNPSEVSVERATFGVSGMTCASCAVSLESWLKNKKGVEAVAVNYPNESLNVTYHPDVITPEALNDAAKEIGYGIFTGDETAREQAKEEHSEQRLKNLRLKLVVAVVCSVPVFVLAMFLMNVFPWENWIMFVLTIPVLFWSGSEFFVNAGRQAKHGKTNMDTLVALSTGVAFFFSALNTVWPEFLAARGIAPHVYFESAVIIITLILLGRYLEERAKHKTSGAIRKLMNLQPQQVRAIRNGEEVGLAIEEIIPGDLILLKPGEKVAVDGKVKSGESYIDESMITGESMPVLKQKKDLVYAGTVNQKGSLKILAQKVGAGTLLSQIIRTVQDAQSSKPPIQKLVDKIAGIFVPVVILIALVSAAIWFFASPVEPFSHAVVILITVLIIACPCALGLATPTALMVGIGRGAEQGMLIKDASVLERAYRLKAIILDKTGTLTEGKPRVTDFAWAEGVEEKNLLPKLLSMELESEHPIAGAVVTHLKEQEVSPEKMDFFESETGRGVKGVFGDENFYVGSLQWMELLHFQGDDSLMEKAATWSDAAQTVIYFAGKGKILAAVAVADQLRPGAKDAVKELKHLGLQVYLLTGDNQKTAAAIAEQVGIENYRAEVMPSDKGDFVRELQQKGMVVAMAGDGINDAEALALADVGIAMGSGTDIAMESAGLTLMHSDPMHLARAISLSKATMNTLRQNLFWAFVYNIVAIPIAAGALYPVFGVLLSPMIAGGAMALSSVSVVLNSLRLRTKKINS